MLPFPHRAVALIALACSTYTPAARGQYEIGFIEEFALAEDRREALASLIPETEDYFYYHCLHYQNTGQLAEAASILQAWRNKFANSPQANNMLARQMLLSYEDSTDASIEFLRRQLPITWNHAAPSRTPTSDLSSRLDASQFTTSSLLERFASSTSDLTQLEDRGLSLILDREWDPQRLRAVISRLRRSDVTRIVELIAEELALRDSQGFGWAHVHRLLTQHQLETLVGLRPELNESEQFLRAYAARLAPSESESIVDPVVLRAYLERLHAWGMRLPESQNSLKALIIGNLLRLNLAEQIWDRDLFLQYLALPRSTAYYNRARSQRSRSALTRLDFQLRPEIPLPPMRDDALLVRKHLEWFLKNDASVDAFSQLLNRDYLERVQAEAKILFGIGDNRSWYAKLQPEQQKALMDRVELEFATHNPRQFQATDEITLDVDVKNVDQLIVRIYKINTRAYYRTNQAPLNTDVDLDGLVANVERRISFDFPSDRRHAESLAFPELDGRGVWIIDLIGAGKRSRALVRKGDLLAVQRLGDAGHVFRIVDENGQLCPDAFLEIAGQEYTPQDGKIIVPYAESDTQRNAVLVDGNFASRIKVNHRSENYELRGQFFVDRQSLQAGMQAKLIVRAGLSCNQQPISLSLLEEPILTISAIDADGLSTQQTVSANLLNEATEFEHAFLVPQRLRSMTFTLSGKVSNANRDVKQAVSSTQTLDCNGISASNQIGDFYFQQHSDGFRALALGRNGEVISGLSIQVSLKHNDFRPELSARLATDAAGRIELGPLADISYVRLDATGMKSIRLEPNQPYRQWPSTLVTATGSPLVLPLGSATAAANSFSLFEIRRGAHYSDASSQMQLDEGKLSIVDLPEGDFLLLDHEVGQSTTIHVTSGKHVDGTWMGKHRFLRSPSAQNVIIDSLQVVDGQLRLELSHATPMTRVHVVGHVFATEPGIGRRLDLPRPPAEIVPHALRASHYVNSIRLDEEYSYILDRQQAAKYPGNMLPSPSLLIHPWQIAETENEADEARAGEAMPGANLAEPAAPKSAADAERSSADATADWKSFEFLETGSVLIANLVPDGNALTIPLEDFDQYTSFTVFAVQEDSTDARTITRPMIDVPLETRDLRLARAFDADLHLTQVQQVRKTSADVELALGDPRSRRVHTFASLADVYHFYASLLDSDRWDDFEFLVRWPQLTDEQKKTFYNQTACHELNYFFYHKDRPFFDSHIAPLIRQKLDPQIFDQWLTGNSVNDYRELWRLQRLNTVERILLAESINDVRPAALRWMEEYVQNNPVSPELLAQRFRLALRANELEESKRYAIRDLFSDQAEVSDAPAAFGGFGGGYGGAEGAMAAPTRSRGRSPRPADAIDSLRRRTLQLGRQQSARSGLAIERGEGFSRDGLFQSLDSTKQWAESQFYRVPLADQTAELILPNRFWHDYLAALSNGESQFLPTNLELPTNSVNEALCALAVIDLPFQSAAAEMTVDNGQLVIKTKAPALVYMESIEATTTSDHGAVLVGQDLYRSEAAQDSPETRPVSPDSLLIGTPYRANVVITNPTSNVQKLQVLTQIPAGAIPLAGAPISKSTALSIAPYSTVKVESEFYFPEPGDFALYGAQVSEGDTHLANADSLGLNVLREPQNIDTERWEYVADWATNEDVLRYLSTANIAALDLERVAFRLHDREFYQAITDRLASMGYFDNRLWAYAFLHRDTVGIEQFLQNNRAFIDRLGSVLDAPILQIQPREQLSYEHLDYRPLVVARQHALGGRKTITNPKMFEQYNRLLRILSHQPRVSDAQRLQLCYYLLLQNRITEALQHFDSVDRGALESHVQYDYLDAYLDFFRGHYDHAVQIAQQYASYPNPRWQGLFRQVIDHVDQRAALQNGEPLDLEHRPIWDEQQDRLLADGRTQRQTERANRAPSLAFDVHDGQITVRHANVKNLRVNYYAMDIELLFSRKPFVTQARNAAPFIQANQTQFWEFNDPSQLGTQTQAVQIPEELRNQNMLVEILGDGVVQTQFVTANALRVMVSEPYGQLQVSSQAGGAPLDSVYVKVYARHRDGSIRFFKDGYTDLRGRFDYASLSTGDLDTAERLSILVLSPELGAVVQEVATPAR